MPLPPHRIKYLISDKGETLRQFGRALALWARRNLNVYQPSLWSCLSRIKNPHFQLH